MMYRRFSHVANLEDIYTQDRNIFTSAGSCCFIRAFRFFEFGRSCIQKGANKSTLPNTQFLLICFYSSLQFHTAFSLPSIPLTIAPLPLIQNPAASNLSKPTYFPSHTQLQPHTDIPPTSYDAFPIPDTDLILKFGVFGPSLEIFELNDLITRAQEDIRIQINQYGADALTPNDGYHPWRTEEIVLEIHKGTPGRLLTLGQFRSLIEGLRLYMIQKRRSRELTFWLTREGEFAFTSLAGGDIWSF